MAELRVDGRLYPFPEPPWTFREDGIVRRIAGYGIGEIDERRALRDASLVAAFAVVAKRRAGELVNEEAVLELPIGSIEVVGDPPSTEATTVPPACAAAEAAADTDQPPPQEPSPAPPGTPPSSASTA